MTGFSYSGGLDDAGAEAAARKLLGEVTGANGILQKLELVLKNNHEVSLPSLQGGGVV